MTPPKKPRASAPRVTKKARNKWQDKQQEKLKAKS